MIQSAGSEGAEGFIQSIRGSIEAGLSPESLVAFAQFLDRDYFGPIAIVSDSYSSIERPEKSTDVTAMLKQIVEQERLLHGPVANVTMGNDPDPGFLKTLVVKILYGSSEMKLAFTKWTYWRLPKR